MSVLVNFVLFQLGWFACVLGAAHGLPYLGPVVVALGVSFHLHRFGRPHEKWLILGSLPLGLLVDTTFLHAGLVEYRSPSFGLALAPAWILALWANLAITLEHSLSWLSSQKGLPFFGGLLFGPLAYWGAAGLGAAAIGPPVPAALAIGIFWGVSLTLLFEAARRLRPAGLTPERSS